MNNRIEELAEQAAHDTRKEHNNAYWRMQDEIAEDATWREKFAKSIVLECISEIKILRKIYDTHKDVEPEENDWYVDAFLQAEVKLKEYFGVEESNRKFPERTFVFDQNDFLYQKGLHDGATLERSKWKLPPDISDIDPNWVDPPRMW